MTHPVEERIGNHLSPAASPARTGETGRVQWCGFMKWIVGAQMVLWKGYVKIMVHFETMSKLIQTDW